MTASPLALMSSFIAFEDSARPIVPTIVEFFARAMKMLPSGAITARAACGRTMIVRVWKNQVAAAMAATGVTALADRAVDELSGGQRQRVWMAMALAQQTGILLLDEPTTYLDIAHQIDLLDLCADLHEQGRTLVAVLHDLNHACRYATHLIVMRAGRIVAEGVPGEIVTAELVEDVYGLPCEIIVDPQTHTPLVVPAARAARAARASLSRPAG